MEKMSKLKIKKEKEVKEPIYLVGDDTVHLSDDDEEEKEEENEAIPEEPRCPQCDKKFKSLRSMVTHHNQAHFGKMKGPVQFECEKCGKSYAKGKYLARHLKKKCTPQ